MTASKKICGVYRWVYVPDGRSYVGSSVDCLRRKQSHIRKMSHPEGKQTQVFHAQAAKLGKENFRFELLEECARNDLYARELAYINKFSSVWPRGFNIRKDPTATWGYEFTEQVRQKMSASRRRNIDAVSAQTKQQMHESRELGVGLFSKEDKLRRAERARKQVQQAIAEKTGLFSIEVRERGSEAQRAQWKQDRIFNSGRCSPEAKAARSARMRATNAKCRELGTGIYSAEFKAGRSRHIKALWENPERAEQMTRRRIETLQRKNIQ